jgi:hypothetical protein
VWRWLWSICVVLVVGVAYWALSTPVRYTSFRDAIVADMGAQGIAVRDVEIIHQWPDTVNDVNFGANLRITLVSGADVWGRLDCRTWRRDCVYTVQAFAIHIRSFPDLVKTSSWRESFVGWLGQRWHALRLSVSP